MITLTDTNRAEIPVIVPAAYSSAYSSAYGGTTGIRVRVHIAMSETEPDEDSGLWGLVAVVETSQTVLTDPLPPRARYWIRGRTEAPGYRPSPWSTPESFDTPDDAALWGAQFVIAQDGRVTFRWRGNTELRGLLVEWSVQANGTTALYGTSVELDALDPAASPYSSAYSSAYGPDPTPWRSRVLAGASVGVGEFIGGRITPYNDYSAGVAGDAGIPVKIAAYSPGAVVGSAYSSAYSAAFGS